MIGLRFILTFSLAFSSVAGHLLDAQNFGLHTAYDFATTPHDVFSSGLELSSGNFLVLSRPNDTLFVVKVSKIGVATVTDTVSMAGARVHASHLLGWVGDTAYATYTVINGIISSDLYIAAIDTHGRVTKAVADPDTTWRHPAGGHIDSNGNLLLHGTWAPYYTYGDAWIGRINRSGVPIEEFTYHWQRNAVINGIIELGNGDMVYCGYAEAINQNGSWNDDGMLGRIDSIGNVLWTAKAGSEYTDGFWSVCQSQDGTFTAVGYVRHAEWYGWMLRVDGLGSIQLERKYGDYVTLDEPRVQQEGFFTNVKFASDGNYRVSGLYWSERDEQRAKWLTKILDYSGDTLNIEYLPDIQNIDTPYSLEFWHVSELADNRWLHVGTVTEHAPIPNQRYAAISVTDYFGCVVNGCEFISAIEPPTAVTTESCGLYPNPLNASGQLKIASDAFKSQGMHQLQVYDLSGKLLSSVSDISIAGVFDLTLPDGMYLIRISSHELGMTCSELLTVSLD